MSSEPNRTVQLHVVMPYKVEPVDQPEVARWLERGYLVRQLQRISDREALVTLVAPDD